LTLAELTTLENLMAMVQYLGAQALNQAQQSLRRCPYITLDLVLEAGYLQHHSALESSLEDDCLPQLHRRE
jgi:hypothetical protein